MSDFKINSIENKNGNYGPVIAGVSTVNSTGCMKIPSGTTARRVEYIPQSENIVRDGLVLHLDFANPDCLIDGTHVRDLSGAGILGIGTIQGQASFLPDGGGCMKFYNNDAGSINFGPVLATPEIRDNFILSADGENRSSGVSTSGTHGSGNDLSVYAWVGGVDMTNAANTILAVWYSTAGSGYLFACNETAKDGDRPQPSAIVSDGGDSSGAWVRPGWNGTAIPEYDPRQLNFYQTVKSVNSGIGNTTITVGRNKFNHLAQRLVRDQVNGIWGVFTHINGLVNGMETPLFPSSGNGYTTETADWGVGRNLRIGRTDDDSSTSNMSGNIAIVMVYNKSLSDAEITQNFNAQRYRFGR